MNIPQIISIALGSLGLGISLSGLLYMALTSPRKQKEKLKRREKKFDYLHTLKQMLNPELEDPRKPLTKRRGETSNKFAQRVYEKLHSGELTPNAARLSLGLSLIPGEDLNCPTCKHRHGLSSACGHCENFNKWEPRTGVKKGEE